MPMMDLTEVASVVKDISTRKVRDSNWTK